MTVHTVNNNMHCALDWFWQREQNKNYSISQMTQNKRRKWGAGRWGGHSVHRADERASEAGSGRQKGKNKNCDSLHSYIRTLETWPSGCCWCCICLVKISCHSFITMVCGLDLTGNCNKSRLLLLPSWPGCCVLLLLLRKLLSILRVVVLVGRKIGMRSRSGGNVGGGRRLIPSGSSGGGSWLRLNPRPSGVSPATTGWCGRATGTTNCSHGVQRTAPRAVGSILMTSTAHI